MEHTFLSLPLLVHDCNVRTRFTEEMVYVLTPKKCYLCSCSLSFPLPPTFTLLATNISHFLIKAIKFHVVFQTKVVSFVFYLSL